jgi:AraC family ethanolamine operon transcriptional activator
MSLEIETGQIHAADIEELNYAVWPWDLRMQQMSPGSFLADLDFAQVNGILLTHERWSRRVTATGATPPGYLALAGVCSERTCTYSGAHIGARSIMCGRDATDIEFATPDRAEHWVMLVPIDLITGYLGDRLAAELLPWGRSFTSDPQTIRQLGTQVIRLIAKLRDNAWCRTDDLLRKAIQAQLLGAATELLACAERDGDRATPRKRFLACRRALRHAEKLNHPISVDELAATVGASRRALELGFRESFDISPQRFLRRVRLNGLHRDLRRASRAQASVTEAATHWGFVELGRTAVEYRKLFGEPPSTTLARSSPLDCQRLADALAFSSNAER